MFDVGFTELVLLAVIAMVVVGPERLPGVIRTLGKTVGQARRFMNNLQTQIEQEVKLSELSELNNKIMAEEQALKKSLEGTHETENAEVPSVPPAETSAAGESTSAPEAVEAVKEQNDTTRS